MNINQNAKGDFGVFSYKNKSIQIEYTGQHY